MNIGNPVGVRKVRLAHALSKPVMKTFGRNGEDDEVVFSTNSNVAKANKINNMNTYDVNAITPAPQGISYFECVPAV